MDLFSSIQIPDSARQRVDELTHLIDRYNHAYYMEDTSLVSDFEFDALLRELIELEKQYPDLAHPNSPTRRVGGEVNKSFRQVTHRHPMLSLGNTYSIAEIEEFEARTRKLLDGIPFSYTCELKYDGVAISLTYTHGQLAQAVTRGNGLVGDDITANARTIPTIPLRLQPPFPADIEVRGEVVYPFEPFFEANRQREADGEEPFANPRNAASGSLKLQDSAQCAKRKLQFCPYFVILPTDDTDHSASQFQLLQSLVPMGFSLPPYTRECRDIQEIKQYIDYWDTHRHTLPYATDGVVIKVNQTHLWPTLGNTAKSPRWAIAYKFKAERVGTPLQQVTYQVGRTGIITPVANMAPVWLGGTTVRRATLVNADNILRLDLHEGDTVFVEKGGEIIPKIVGVDTALRHPGAQPVRFPVACPVCGTPLVREPGEAAHYCPNHDGCTPQILGRLLHFVSRKAMNIDTLGAERIKLLFEAGLLHDVADFYALRRDQLIGLASASEGTAPSLQEKSADNILSAVQASRAVPFERVLYALGIPYVGEVAARKLARHFRNIDTLFDATVEALAAVPDVGQTTAQALRLYFDDPANRSLVQRLREAGLQLQVDESQVTDTPLSNRLSGKTIVVSGTFAHFSRDGIKQSIEQHGGRASSSVTSRTSFLLAGEKPGPEKIKKAADLSIPVISEQQYLQMIQEPSSTTPADTQLSFLPATER